ncbi:MAG: transcription termination/antitermination protein NusG [Treponemataceae bacterium]|nr:transcription termination/antitermination protein NusG [Treponemataceae bacterium]
MAKSWYILHTYTGYEGKIERTIRTLLDKNELSPEVVIDVKVPVEEVVEVKDGKKKTRSDKFLPGYIMIELDLPEVGWKATCSTIRRIQGVTGFVGTNPNERPRPITTDEAKNLLQKSGAIKGEKQIKIKQSYVVGDQVKITDGPFASFSGTIEEVNVEKDKLRVNVQIFGRATPVEVSMLQVEKV